jgi:hypothetical protein
MVFRGSGFAEVTPSIVGRFSVAMVNFVFRPCTSYPQPYNSMRQIAFVADAYADVSEPADTAYYISDFYAVTGRYFSSQQACRWVVAKKTPNLFGGKITKRVLRPSDHLLRTSSTARRITSASVIPSFVACLSIQACWDAVRTICRWMPLVMFGPFQVVNGANIHTYYKAVK